MELFRASEDYLEAMLMLQKANGFIRSSDIAEKLKVTKPSVTYTTKRLRNEGYITMAKDGLITLTGEGLRVAEEVLERHTKITALLVSLGVSPETAEADACRIEHVISVETYDALCAKVK